MLLIAGAALVGTAIAFYTLIYYLSRLPRLPMLAGDGIVANVWMPLILVLAALGVGAIVEFAGQHDTGVVLAGEIVVAVGIAVATVLVVAFLVRRTRALGAPARAAAVAMEPPMPPDGAPGPDGPPVQRAA